LFDKARQFSEQITALKQKLQNSQQGESLLRQQLRQSEDVRQQLQKSVQMLTEDRNSQERRCQRVETELSALRKKLDNSIVNPKRLNERFHSETRKDPLSASVISNNTSIYENGPTSDKRHPPVPAPRTLKESSDRELRNEVDSLRGEVSNLRE